MPRLINVRTSNITPFKALGTLLEEISEDNIKILFKKDESFVIKAINKHKTLLAVINFDVSKFDRCYVRNSEFSCLISVTELNKCLKGIDTDGYIMALVVEEDDDKVLKITVEKIEDE